MLTVWEASFESEAKLLLHQAKYVANGFFRINGFNLLPRGTSFKDPSMVTFPDLPYLQRIPRFWDKTARLPVNSWEVEDEELLGKAVQLVKEAGLPLVSMVSLQDTWQKAESKILKAIESLIPESEGKIEKIIIHPTSWGTTSSFNLIKSYPATIEFFLREDQDIYAIVEAILTSLTRVRLEEELGALWSESELLVDWLITKSSLKRILHKYEPKTNYLPTMLRVRGKQQAGLALESEKFYTKLGVPHKADRDILLNKANGFSPKEKAILKLLINNEGKVVSIDEISSLIFVSEEDFSLYAISKFIQRLRDKLEAQGISGSVIQTLRGQGYCLRI